MLSDEDIRKGITALGAPLWEGVVKASHTPAETQKRVLLGILRANAETTFGKEHGFDSIRTVRDYRERVPIRPYQAFDPLIRAQDREKRPYLTAENPFRYFQTSGTTGHSKFIPVLKRTVEEANHRATLFNYLHFRTRETFFSGKVLSYAGPAVDGKTPSGTPAGSFSGMLYEQIPPPMMHKFVLPRTFPQILDHEAKHFLMAGLALTEPALCLLVAPNPSIFIKFLDLLRDNWEALLAFVAGGKVAALDLDPAFSRFLPEGFRGNPKRSKELERAVRDPAAASFGTLWPNLHTVVTWTTGSCGALLPEARKLFPGRVRFLEAGFLASEFIGTLTIDDRTNLQMPTLYHVHFEFVEEGEWDARGEDARVLGLDEIEEGACYQIIVTTTNGFYRYAINDVVEVTGRFHRTPTFQFIRKGKGVTDLARERLYENHLTSAIHALTAKHGVGCAFFLMVGDRQKRAYTLYLETGGADADWLGKVFEQELAAANVGYGMMRREGALEPLEVVFLQKGTGEAYKRHCLAKGQREAQYKAVTLQYREDCDFDFVPFRQPKRTPG